MNIVIVGAGEVGRYLAKILSQEKHAVTIVDKDPVKAQTLTESLDVQAIVGDGTRAGVLNQAGTSKADLVVVVTDQDKVNMLASHISKQLGATRVILRLHDMRPLDGYEFFYKQALGFDVVLSTEVLAANFIVEMVRHMHEKYGVDFVNFLDENLMTMDQSSGRVWMKEICRLWHEYDLVPKHRPDGTWSGVHWAGTSHATLCTKEILKIMREAGCSHLIYGYESFAPHVMKTIGKGATPETNIRSFYWTLEAGIRPVPNQIIGFPNDDFDSIRLNMKAWKRLGLVVKPHFATPYPGSEWFTVYRSWIEEQYDGDLEAFILDLGDATQISATISHNFDAVELIGLREMMLNFNDRAITAHEELWRRTHNIPDGAPSTLFPKRSQAAE